MAIVSQPYSDLELDQQAMLYPMLGYLHRDRNLWRVLAQGRFYRHVPITLSKRLLMRGLQRVMNVPREEFSEELFQKRLEGFLVASEAKRQVVLQVGSLRFPLRKKTRSSGLFQSTFDIPIDLLEQVAPEDAQAGGQMNIQLALHPESGRGSPIEGSLFLVPPKGLSVISDIDDTIKRTQVTQKRAMLANTFVHPFQAIEGMSALYQQWSQQGAVFHYVSSSPWQIYPAISEFFAAQQFPAGSMHLRWFRLRDEIVRKWQILRRRGKYGIAAGLLKRFPQRQFMLIGDSGERDPEIYSRLAKRYSNQVAMVVIRQVADHPLEGRRLGKVMQTMRKIPFMTFENASEIQAIDITSM
jgi:phosphatidate phosphatase APP1